VLSQATGVEAYFGRLEGREGGALDAKHVAFPHDGQLVASHLHFHTRKPGKHHFVPFLHTINRAGLIAAPTPIYAFPESFNSVPATNTAVGWVWLFRTGQTAQRVHGTSPSATHFATTRQMGCHQHRCQ
jgi:hypothetical protein